MIRLAAPLHISVRTYDLLETFYVTESEHTHSYVIFSSNFLFLIKFAETRNHDCFLDILKNY